MDKNVVVDLLEAEVVELRQKLSEKEDQLFRLKFGHLNNESNPYTGRLSAMEVSRYSRQILVPEIGVQGQILLKNSNVLIVGMGGLGCPAALYLVSAGIGKISILDNDEVEISNLHRQVLHNENKIGIKKVKSGHDTLQTLNRNVDITQIHIHASGSSLKEHFAKNKYDVVIDGTDNVATRYLLNDVCVLHGIPLVSGSALQLEGQLTVYNHNGGPCYRCMFPVPPPPETVTSCGDGGVLGPVPGMIGVLQALETIKILTKQEGVLSGRFLTFDGSNTTFRNIKLRPRSKNCDVCGDNPTIKDLIDYEQFCGAKADDKIHNINILGDNSSVPSTELKTTNQNITVIDVRPAIEYEMCSLEKSLNIPYTSLKKPDVLANLREKFKQYSKENKSTFYVLCRRGNDSQRAIVLLKEEFSDLPIKFFNVRGGLHSYASKVDPLLPIY